jgi:hypothetical protein
MLVAAVFTTSAKKTVYPSATLKIPFKLSPNMARQKASRLTQVRLKLGSMALDKLVK